MYRIVGVTKMQIQNVQNNHFNTNFRAIPQIKGMEKFPSEAVKVLEEEIKSIGSKDDIIAVHLNGIEPTFNQMKKFREGLKGGYEQYWQNIDIASFIDGELTPKRIRVHVVTKNVATRKMNVRGVMMAISNYLYSIEKGEYKNVAGTEPIKRDIASWFI